MIALGPVPDVREFDNENGPGQNPSSSNGGSLDTQTQGGVFSPQTSGGQPVSVITQQRNGAMASRSPSSGSTLTSGVGPLKDHFVLLCCFRGTQICASETKILDSMRDAAFLRLLRLSYRQALGPLRYYFEPKTFWYCELGLSRKRSGDRFHLLCHEIPCLASHHFRQSCNPCTEKYSYEVRTHRPQVSKQLWIEAYKDSDWPDDCNEILPYIPKREKDFGLHKASCSLEYVWDLHVVTRPCCWKVLAYLAASCLGGITFWIFWIHGHPADWQDAATILFAVLAGAGPVMSLNYRFQPDWCSNKCGIHM